MEVSAKSVNVVTDVCAESVEEPVDFRAENVIYCALESYEKIYP